MIRVRGRFAFAWILRSLVLAGLVPFMMMACSGKASQKSVSLAVMLASNPTAEATLFSCLFNAYQQGLTIQAAYDLCHSVLSEGSQDLQLDPLGRGGISLGGGESDGGVTFGAGACGRGDPRLGSGSAGTPIHEPALGENLTYGGEKGSEFKNGGGWGKWAGLSEQEARDSRQVALDKHNAALLEFATAKDTTAKATKERERVLADPQSTQSQKDAAVAAENQAKADEKKKRDASTKAGEAAKADPNRLPPNVAHPGLNNRCAEAMARAAAVLIECNRNGWKSPGCASLLAKMQGCPDPSLIYPNPADGSISCGELALSDDVRRAWDLQCDPRLVLYGPEGVPCKPLDVDGKTVKARPEDVCNDPRAHVTEDNCIIFVRMGQGYDETLMRIPSDIIIWAVQHKLGGPVFVLPVEGPCQRCW